LGTKPTIVQPCTCGRKPRDLTELAVIREQFGKAANGKPCSYSLVVCLRDNCLGQFRSGDKYVATLPKVWWKDYWSQKKVQQDLDPGI